VKIFKVSKSADQESTPWKNGGGETTQLALFPKHASFEKEDFFWRVSKAKIQKSGPFSPVKGFVRGLVQLSGVPVRLNSTKLHLFESFLFSGDTTIQCELPGGEATDINVMVNRAWGEFKMTAYQLEKGKRLARYADYVCYYCHHGEMDVEGTQLGAGDFIVLEKETSIQALTDLNLIVIELTELKRT
jgi:environmental stress-induced protein Ves